MQKHNKKQPISTLKQGEIVNDVFVVKIKKAMAPYTKGFSFDLLLSDNSGKSIEYKYWGGPDEKRVKTIYDSIKADSVVLVQAKVSTYNGKLQLVTNEPGAISVLAQGQYDTADFIKPAKKDIEKMYSEVLAEIESIKNSKIKKLMENIFHDSDFREKFKRHPGAIEIHHNWIGGLMQHSLELLNYCKLAQQMNPELDRDLLIAGALLHDLGKLEELETTTRIKGTQKGQLAGHLVLSILFVSEKMKELDFEPLMRNKILHMMVSHHGKHEYGSPKEPMFPEALAVYYADEMSSKLAEMLEFIKYAKNDTEDDFMFSRRHDRNILLR